MAKLRFAFSGVCIVTPGRPEDGSNSATEVSAVLPFSPRARASSSGEQIDALFPFLFFSATNLVSDETSRKPDIVFEDPTTHQASFGAVLLHREVISILEDPSSGIRYVQEGKVLPDQPRRGFDNDVRWVCDFREIDPTHARLKKGCRPKPGDGKPANEKLGAHIIFRSGVLSAGFPCPIRPPVTFLHTDVTRRFAQEIILEMELPDGVSAVTLQSESLSDGFAPAQDLKVRSVHGEDIDILVGNGPISSLYDLAAGRCHGHDHSGPIDYEFEVMYDLLEFPEALRKPVPMAHAELIRDCYAMML